MLKKAALSKRTSGGYGKRALWQWIVLYLIVGGFIYYAIYYFVLGGKGYSQDSYYQNSDTSDYGYP